MSLSSVGKVLAEHLPQDVVKYIIQPMLMGADDNVKRDWKDVAEQLEADYRPNERPFVFSTVCRNHLAVDKRTKVWWEFHSAFFEFDHVPWRMVKFTPKVNLSTRRIRYYVETEELRRYSWLKTIIMWFPWLIGMLLFIGAIILLAPCVLWTKLVFWIYDDICCKRRRSARIHDMDIV